MPARIADDERFVEDPLVVGTEPDRILDALPGDARAQLPDAAAAARHASTCCRDALSRLALADEDAQQVWQRALVSLRQYDGRQTLAAWLCAAIARETAAPDEHERLLPRPLVPLGDDVEPAFKEAVDEAASRLTPRERNLLRFHLNDRLSLDHIGVIYGAPRAEIASWLADARSALLTHVQHALRAHPDAPDGDGAWEALAARFEAVALSQLSTRGDERRTDEQRPSARERGGDSEPG